MHKLLIAVGSEDQRILLRQSLYEQYEIYECETGLDAVKQVIETKPDIMIMDLILPYLDGLSVLEQIKAHKPPIIVALTGHVGRYALDVAHQLGVSYIISVPMNMHALLHRLDDLVSRTLLTGDTDSSEEKLISGHLMTLGFQPKLDGYQQLRIAIPMYAKDPAQRICKELYPDVAKVLGVGSGKQVERSIRNGISITFENADRRIWEQYFPNIQEPPTNKQFISRLADYLINE